MKRWIVALSLIYASLTFAYDIHDFKDLQVEFENKLVVPPELVDAAWLFLVSTFVVDQTSLGNLASGLTSHTSEEFDTDHYYDRADHFCLNSDIGLRHRNRFKLTNPTDPKNLRQIFQMKLSKISDDPYERGELKYELPNLTSPFFFDDAPFAMLNSQQAKKLETDLAVVGLKISELEKLISLYSHRRRINFKRNGEPYIYLTLDQIRKDPNSEQPLFTEIEIELAMGTYEVAKKKEKERMKAVCFQLSQEIMRRFPTIKSDLTPKFKKAYLGI